MSNSGNHVYQVGLKGSPPLGEEPEQHASWGENIFPMHSEIAPLYDLRRADKVVEAFRGIDWSFSDADTDFLTHSLHPYPAKFIPQIPSHCIRLLTAPGELVLDPFGGSGTTALEAIRLGRRALSVDANHVGTLIGQVKTCNLDAESEMDLRAIRSSLTTWLGDLPHPAALCKEYQTYIPDIPHIDKWFPLTSRGELAFIRSRIGKMETVTGQRIALLALSRTVLSASFQDSETRYASKPRDIPRTQTLRHFLGALEDVLENVRKTQPELRYGVCKFLTANTMHLAEDLLESDSVDLIVTSPPYGNANDYHLYHRFRLMWLGNDPRELGKIEIGSHLRHQRESSGFDAYMTEMEHCLKGMFRVLRPGRYAVLVVGDAMYQKVIHPVAPALSAIAGDIGFETVCTVVRPIHSTKRSFGVAGRRATTEKLLVLRKKPPKQLSARLQSPPYKLWPYESTLRKREINVLLGADSTANGEEEIYTTLDPYSLPKARKLVFTHKVKAEGLYTEPTWQAIVENGLAQHPSARKDPKYVTHGLHPYKGKFYPQLAKGLMNLCDLSVGARVFDPFCGSGTTLLESYLNGYSSYGCDLNPLAAKIAKAKVGILEVNPDVVREAVATLVARIENAPVNLPEQWEQLDESCYDEIQNWFPKPIISKLNWLLWAIRSVSDGVVRDFLEVILSSIIRDVSQQNTSDLRIRRRKEAITDADVFNLYLATLGSQYERIERFWSIRGYSPNAFSNCQIIEGDSRDVATMTCLGLESGSVDLVLTSPPYATALPYIDTDRLSMLVLFGMKSSTRRPIERNLVGSREITTGTRRQLEQRIIDREGGLPDDVHEYLFTLLDRVSKADVGFRRKNMPALLLRFFEDMGRVIRNCHTVLRTDGEAMIVIGDNRMRVNNDYERIPTTDFVEAIAIDNGFQLVERIDISVTTENLVHIKNAITKNVVLRLAAVPQDVRVTQA